MSDNEMKRLYSFAFLAMAQAAAAVYVLWNELWSINHSVPGGNYPIEHQSSWPRVILFFITTVIYLLVVLVFAARKNLPIQLPSIQSRLMLAVVPVLSGILLSHYLSTTGWCCETSHAFYFGFPFSLLRGISFSIFDQSIRQYADAGLFEILREPDLILTWEFLPYQFILNMLFWFSIIFLLHITAGIIIYIKNQSTRGNNGKSDEMIFN